MEVPEAGAELTKEEDCEEELHKGGGGPPKPHHQGVG